MNYLIILFSIIFIVLCIIIIRYIIRNDVVLISKVTEGCCQQVFSTGSLPIAPINGGLEYTFSIWIYISGWEHRYDDEKVILYWKGRNIRDEVVVKERGDDVRRKGISGKYGGLKMILAPKDNDLIVSQSLLSGETEEVVIKNIPLQKWLNVIVMMRLRNLDVFLNGSLYSNKFLKGVPLYNAHKLVIDGEGGFDGLINKLVYYNRALTYPEIKSIWNTGKGY